MKKLIIILLLSLTLVGCDTVESNTELCASNGGTYILGRGYCEDTHTHSAQYYTKEEVDSILQEYITREEMETLDNELNNFAEELENRFSAIAEDLDNTYNKEQMPYVYELYLNQQSQVKLEQWLIENPDATEDEINVVNLKITGLKLYENFLEDMIDDLEDYND